MAAERKTPTTKQFFGSMLSRDQSKKDTEERAIPCKILHVDHELSESVGCGVLVCNPQFDKFRKHFIITSNRVIKNENFADECKVEFKRNAKVSTFNLQDVKNSVFSDASGVMIIFINSQNLKHMKYQKFPLTRANFDQNQTPFCYVEDHCYNIESNNENGKYFLKWNNSDTSADQLTNATSKEMSNGTVILQGSGKENMKAVGIFNMEDATQMVISPIWLKPSVTDISAPTTDGRQTSSPTDTVAVTATNEPQSTVGSGDTPANTTNNQELPAAGTDQTTEATANQQPTGGANGNDGVEVDASASSSSAPVQEEQGGEIDQHEETATANQQPTDGVDVDASTSSSSAPVQEEQGEETVDSGSPQDSSDSGDASTGTQSYENVPVSEKDTSFIRKLAVGLDRTPHRVIKGWEHLADTKEINAPLDVRLRCGINSEKSCTQSLFDVFTAEFVETTLGDLIDALTSIGRNDVKLIITDSYKDAPHRTIKFYDFARDKGDLIFKMTNKLDKKSSVNKNWRFLGGGAPFRLSAERLDEIEFGQSTQILMQYLYEKENFTIGYFYDKVKELQRGDVVRILDRFMNESDRTMKEVIKLDDENMRSICVLFNKPITGSKGWKHLAKSFDVPEDIYNDCAPERPKSPTETLFEWIFAVKDPQLTVGQLCNALKSIGRNELVEEVRKSYEQQSARQP